MFDRDRAEAQLIARKNDPVDFPTWCLRNDVDPGVLALMGQAFGPSKDFALIAAECFVSAWDGRKEVEPKGKCEPGPNGERFVVQHAVVDTTDGRIVAPLTSSLELAEDLAGLENEPIGGLW